MMGRSRKPAKLRAAAPVVCLAAVVSFPACKRPVARDFVPQFDLKSAIASDVPDYEFGVQPMRSTRQLYERYSMLVAVLNSSVSGFKLHLVSAQTDERYDQKLKSRELDVAIVEPHRVLEAERLGYKAIAKVGNADRIAGVIVIRTDSEIRRIADLKGKRIAFPSPSGLASAMMVRMFLRDAGF